ncbi:MAG: STAS domain-containing protein [Candidatus Eremiobacteraeota bacterium]|nr:STAS domain-containing protein [Candidatus Eremiobacteraeota bacterium]
MKEEQRFRVEQIHGLPLVDVSGEVDLTNVEQLEATLESAAQADRGAVIVSLLNAAYFDSRTIHALLRFADRLSTNRQQLLLVAPHGGSPGKILKIAGLTETLSMYESIDEAVVAAQHLGGTPP